LRVIFPNIISLCHIHSHIIMSDHYYVNHINIEIRINIILTMHASSCYMCTHNYHHVYVYPQLLSSCLCVPTTIIMHMFTHTYHHVICVPTPLCAHLRPTQYACTYLSLYTLCVRSVYECVRVHARMCVCMCACVRISAMDV
jgi:hypothetical protein